MKISEVKNALTLEQLKKMDGQRVLVPETDLEIGGFYVIDAERSCAYRLYGTERLQFADYLAHWIAVVDPFGVLEVKV